MCLDVMGGQISIIPGRLHFNTAYFSVIEDNHFLC